MKLKELEKTVEQLQKELLLVIRRISDINEDLDEVHERLVRIEDMMRGSPMCGFSAMGEDDEF